jgi:hypothetical protein
MYEVSLVLRNRSKAAVQRGFTMFIRQLVIALVLLTSASIAVGQNYPGVPSGGGYGGYGAPANGYAAPGGGGCGGACGSPGCGMPGPAQNLLASPAVAAPATAMFGWARAGDCAGCGVNGYHPGAAAYPPIMGGGQPAFPGGVFPGMDGGYQDQGGTCCGPHWFDFLFEAVFLTRTGDDSLGLMSQGIRGLAPPNIVLSSDDIDFDLAAAFRAAAHWQLNAVNFIEGIYLGGLDWDDTASVFTNSSDLYSAFSDFGNSPFGGFADTDQATQSTLFYESELDSVEANYRTGWISTNNKSSGTWLIGGRYIRLQDTLQHSIIVTPHFDPINMVDRPAASSQYDIDIENDMAGAQVGTELVHCFSPGLLIGAEGKAMAFANRMSQESQLQSTTLQPPLAEPADDTDFSWGTEARVFALWQFHPWMKLRFGYELLFLDRVATAFENYDSTPPFIGPSASNARVPNVQNDGRLLFHGFSVGFEVGW